MELFLSSPDHAGELGGEEQQQQELGAGLSVTAPGNEEFPG